MASEQVESMSLSELLAKSAACGLTLRADGESLVVRGPKSADKELVQTLLRRKADLLPLLDLRQQLAAIEATYPGGRFDDLTARVVAHAVRVCEGILDRWEWERDHGYDPEQLLQQGVEQCLRLARGEKLPAVKAPAAKAKATPQTA